MSEFKHVAGVRRGCGEQRRLWPSLHISEWCPSPSFRSMYLYILCYSRLWMGNSSGRIRLRLLQFLKLISNYKQRSLDNSTNKPLIGFEIETLLLIVFFSFELFEKELSVLGEIYVGLLYVPDLHRKYTLRKLWRKMKLLTCSSLLK